MLKTHLAFKDELKNYRNPTMKLTGMVTSGELIRVVREGYL